MALENELASQAESQPPIASTLRDPRFPGEEGAHSIHFGHEVRLLLALHSPFFLSCLPSSS